MGVPVYPRKQGRLNDVEESDFTSEEKTHCVTLHKKDVFWDEKDAVHFLFLYQGTINVARYCDTLTKLRSIIRRKDYVS